MYKIRKTYRIDFLKEKRINFGSAYAGHHLKKIFLKAVTYFTWFIFEKVGLFHYLLKRF